MKKGQGLSLDMVVIAVIVLVVLFVIIAFFSGGFTAIAEKIGGLFRGGIDDRAVSIQLCNTYCLSAKGYELRSLQQMDSKYCTARFSIDTNKDGKLSEGEKEVTKCSDSDLDVDCMVSGEKGAVENLKNIC